MCQWVPVHVSRHDTIQRSKKKKKNIYKRDIGFWPVPAQMSISYLQLARTLSIHLCRISHITFPIAWCVCVCLLDRRAEAWRKFVWCPPPNLPCMQMHCTWTVTPIALKRIVSPAISIRLNVPPIVRIICRYASRYERIRCRNFDKLT